MQRHPHPVLACCLALLSFTACGDGTVGDSGGGTPTAANKYVSDKIADKGNILAAWRSTEDADLAPLVEAMRSSKLVEDSANSLNDTLRFPRDLTITHMDCGEENALYVSKDHSIVMCYELLKRISVTVFDETSSNEDTPQALIRTWLFVMFHELGHALIDQYQLPVTGQAEDAVDDFSTLVLIDGGLADLALNASLHWAKAAPGMYDSLGYANEHSLSEQRFVGILCSVFGSDPEQYAELVDSGVLPASRAARCPSEYTQKRKSWNRLLEPYAQ